jgi:hypothetical protein
MWSRIPSSRWFVAVTPVIFVVIAQQGMSKKTDSSMDGHWFDCVYWTPTGVEIFFSYAPYAGIILVMLGFPTIVFTWLLWPYPFLAALSLALLIFCIPAMFFCRQFRIDRHQNIFQVRSGFYPLTKWCSYPLDSVELEVIRKDMGYMPGSTRWIWSLTEMKMVRMYHMGFNVKLFANVNDKRYLLLSNSFGSESSSSKAYDLMRRVAHFIRRPIKERKELGGQVGL